MIRLFSIIRLPVILLSKNPPMNRLPRPVWCVPNLFTFFVNVANHSWVDQPVISINTWNNMSQCEIIRSHKTCRWLKEITTAINVICPSQPSIQKCPLNLDLSWNRYLESLQDNPQCFRRPEIQQILTYQVDYHEFLHK